MKKALGLLGILAALIAQGCGCHGGDENTATTNVDMSGDQASAPSHIAIKPMSIKGVPQATREGNQGVAGVKSH